VYRTIIRRRIVSNFERLSAGDYKRVVGQLAPDVHHVFAGGSALGGERHSRAAVERWFERLFRLFPQIRFDVIRVISSGPPWVARACEQMATHGIEEAVAAPITG
jgi:ketosteroid isomerase-like protein